MHPSASLEHPFQSFGSPLEHALRNPSVRCSRGEGVFEKTGSPALDFSRGGGCSHSPKVAEVKIVNVSELLSNAVFSTYVAGFRGF